jgi:hypothetical protein
MGRWVDGDEGGCRVDRSLSRGTVLLRMGRVAEEECVAVCVPACVRVIGFKVRGNNKQKGINR